MAVEFIHLNHVPPLTAGRDEVFFSATKMTETELQIC